MSKAEEVRELADQVDDDGWSIAEIRTARDALRAYADLLEERAKIEEQYRMQLVAISVLSCCNTRGGLEQNRLPRNNPYWTVAHDDVCRAVEREIDLLEEREREERLLRFHCIPSIRMSNSQGLLYRWTSSKELDWVEHPDRATAAKLAEEKINGPA